MVFRSNKPAIVVSLTGVMLFLPIFLKLITKSAQDTSIMPAAVFLFFIFEANRLCKTKLLLKKQHPAIKVISEVNV